MGTATLRPPALFPSPTPVLSVASPVPAGLTRVSPTSWRAGTLTPRLPAPPPAAAPLAKVSSGDAWGTLGQSRGAGGIPRCGGVPAMAGQLIGHPQMAWQRGAGQGHWAGVPGSPGRSSLCPGRGNAGGPGGDGGAEDGAVPLLLPLVPRAHLPREGGSAGATGGAGGPRRLPGAAERDAPRRVRAHLQLPGQSKGTGGRGAGAGGVEFRRSPLGSLRAVPALSHPEEMLSLPGPLPPGGTERGTTGMQHMMPRLFVPPHPKYPRVPPSSPPAREPVEG